MSVSLDGVVSSRLPDRSAGSEQIYTFCTDLHLLNRSSRSGQRTGNLDRSSRSVQCRREGVGEGSRRRHARAKADGRASLGRQWIGSGSSRVRQGFCTRGRGWRRGGASPVCTQIFRCGSGRQEPGGEGEGERCKTLPPLPLPAPPACLSVRFLVVIAAVSHPFPSRTRS